MVAQPVQGLGNKAVPTPGAVGATPFLRATRLAQRLIQQIEAFRHLRVLRIAAPDRLRLGRFERLLGRNPV